MAPNRQYTHTIDLDDGTAATLTWQGGPVAAPAARVYALAFVGSDRMLLVSGGPNDRGRWLPGGGVEAGESAEQALRRELIEEADARIAALHPLGCQRVDFADGRREYHAVYWCRVVLDPPARPRPEPTIRHVVAVDRFLDTLSWGREDPKAPLLLELARAAESSYHDGAR